mgnify:CR=1
KNNNTNMQNSKESNKDTRPINTYKPTGRLIYNNDIINSLNNSS